MRNFSPILTASLLSAVVHGLPSTTTPTATTVTNPWNADCPVPPTYTVNNFISTSGDNGTIAGTITYGNGTFTCPTAEDRYNGEYDMNCDPDGLVRIISDGSSWIWVQEWFWCLAVPQGHMVYNTLATNANVTNLASVLECSTSEDGIKTCKQTTPDFVIPVGSYGEGGIIGFEPIDINGQPVANCPSINEENPVVVDTENCTHLP